MHRYSYFFALSIFIFSCGGHLGSPLDIPGAVGGEIHDAKYRARRKRVFTYVKANEEKIRKRDEAAIDEAIRIAEVPSSKIQTIKDEFKDPKNPFLHPNKILAEKLSDQYLILYPPDSAGKSNGFSFNTFYDIILSDVKARPDLYYRVSKGGKADELDSTLDALHIKEDGKRLAYVKTLNDAFESIYVEPLVVLFMVY